MNASEMNHIKQMPSTSASTAVAAVFHGLANVLHAAISPLAYWASMVLGVFTVDALEYVFPVTRRVHLLHNFPDILARRGQLRFLKRTFLKNALARAYRVRVGYGA